MVRSETSGVGVGVMLAGEINMGGILQMKRLEVIIGHDGLFKLLRRL